ncbi:lipid-binding SYLF domain-containing protein [Lysobacter korlensis]|uniref:Lipid-binding SYLF domain-containing protein n=1 Tax=Lysobacter korlensis TaxID=553636 RepID=A0ABV6RH64_9GAMM
MPRLPRIAALVLALTVATSAVAGPTEDARARNALRVLGDIREIPESAIPEKLLDEARAIVVVPDALKVGLVFGGRRGHGLLSVKRPDGSWSAPSFVKLTGGSVGFQAGVQSADIVLVFRSERGLDSIVNGKITLGADAGVAAGPVGRNAATATDGQLKAEIWSWSRARGLFAGIALDGAVLTIDDSANQAVYGAGTTPRMIFEGRTAAAPSEAIVDFRDHLEEATASARVSRGGSTVASTRPAAVAQPQPALPAAGQAQPQPFETVEQPTRIEPLP